MRRASSCPRIPLGKHEGQQTSRNLTLFEFLWGEFYSLNNAESPELAQLLRNERNSLFDLGRLPIYIEKISLLGILMCFAVLLDFAVLLPCRIIIVMLKKLFCLGNSVNFDFHYVILLIPAMISAFVLNHIDISWLYHGLRGRSVMSLFLYFHVSYVSEKIFSTMGVDFFPFVYRKFNLNYVFEFIGLIGYSVLHSLAVFFTIVSLHAAMNSLDSSFIAIICSSNFMELKGSVLKRYSEENIFQIFCNDIVERFQHVFLGFLILFQTWANKGDIEAVLWYIFWILLMEIIVDFVKHMFILKFNRISAAIFEQYEYTICKDWKETHLSSSNLHDRISSRIGIIVLPNTALVSIVHFLKFFP